MIFVSGLGRVAKYLFDNGGLQLVSEIQIPGFEQQYLSQEETASLVDDLDAAETDEETLLARLQPVVRETGIKTENWSNGLYTMMDVDGFYYPGYGTELIKVGDISPDDPASEIEIVNSRDLRLDAPEDLQEQISRFLGVNMTYDGKIVVAMAGAIAIVDRDMSNVKIAPIPGEIVDNGVSVDEKGGIYVVTDQYMRKLVWTGTDISLEEADGAWKEPYDWVKKEGSLSNGSGTTPTLLGFGEEEDKLVIIADQGDPVKAVAFWRDEIPEDAKKVEGAKTQRTAASIPLSFPVATTIEWSPHVFGNGMMMFASEFPEPVYLDGEFDLVSTQVTMGLTRPAPRGAEKFSWDWEKNEFKSDWVYDEKTFTWTLSPVSVKDGTAYLATVGEGVYGLVGFDWETGEKVADISFGQSVKFNTGGTFAMPTPDGGIYLTGIFGPVRIAPQ